MAEILYGKPVTESIRNDIRERAKKIRDAGTMPRLAVPRSGERLDDLAYEKRVFKICDDIGISHMTCQVDRDVSQRELELELSQLNSDRMVHGILVFRPLPDHIDDELICSIMSVDKDIDCMNPNNLKYLFTGLKEGFAPCTPEAVIALLDYYGYDLDGANVVIVNRSLVLGKPLAMLFMNRNATVTVCHSHTKDLPEITRRADILVTGIGSPHYFGPEYVGSNTTVIDVGINFDENGKMTGDVDFDRVKDKVAAISPVPGGVGGITSTILLRHLIESAERYI